MFEELRDTAEKLSARACNLQLACLENNKEMILHYIEEVVFWSNAVLTDYFEIQKEVNK